MLRKSLLLSACFCLLAAPMALAAGNYDYDRGTQQPAFGHQSAAYLNGGMCYAGENGRGDVIDWAANELQCRTQTNGQSWGGQGTHTNFHRGR